jgi:ADP-dependent NAD(P)H-hydrate dehydratase
MKRAAPRAVTRSLLRRMPLPSLDDDADKEERGRALIIGGSIEIPGAVLLAGIGALRAGAGKLQLATVSACAPALGLAIPEARVIGLRADRRGEIASGGQRGLAEAVAGADAVVIGPGMSSQPAARALVSVVAPRMRETAALVLDAGVLPALAARPSLIDRLGGRAIMTPHPGEMAAMLGIEKKEVEARLPETAILAAGRYGAVVVLKSSETWIAAPEGELFRFRGGGVGLGTSGSGDVLTGIVAGLLARGARPAVAAAWGVWLHGTAGVQLSRMVGKVGFLARELADEVPGLLGSP